MRTQTPGCPVTGLYHPDDKREKLSARVFVSAALVSILAVLHCQCAGCCDDLGTFLKQFKGFAVREECQRRVRMEKKKARTRCAVLGV